MDTGESQLEQLLRRYAPGAGSAATEQLSRYLELVAQYSAALNLTGFGLDQPALCAELVGEALRLLALAEIPAGTNVVDLGSGNGSPVVPLAVLSREARFTAVESRRRRAEFLKLLKVKLQLDNLTVANRRAEELASERPAAFQLLTSRAFAPPAPLLMLASKLLAPGGEVRGYLGADPAGLSAAAAEHGFSVEECDSYKAGDSTRHIYRLRRL